MDQAKTLRKMACGEIVEINKKPCLEMISEDMKESARDVVRVIAVTSGKGGVGKTNVVVNLACSLRKLGSRVCILDADLGLGNIDVLLGLAPKFNIHHVLLGQKKLSEIVIDGPAGIKIIPASSGIQEMAELDDNQRLNILSQVEDLEDMIDILLLDTGAGISSNVTYFSVAAQEIVIVATPEPTSITDAYAVMKVLSQRYSERFFKLLVNGVATPREASEVYKKLSLTADRFLQISIDYLGHILLDANLVAAVRQQKALVEINPSSPASQCFKSLAQKIKEARPSARPKGGLQFFWRQLLERTWPFS